MATVGLGGILDRGILRRTPYDGRRSFASALIHEGRSVVEVAGQLGHSSASTMLCHYARIVEAARAGDRATLADAVAGLRQACAASGHRGSTSKPTTPRGTARPVASRRRAADRANATVAPRRRLVGAQSDGAVPRYHRARRTQHRSRLSSAALSASQVSGFLTEAPSPVALIPERQKRLTLDACDEAWDLSVWQQQSRSSERRHRQPRLHAHGTPTSR